MSQPTTGVRFEADRSITSATRPPVPPELKRLDRKAGNFVVNKWTYRAIRPLVPLLLPKFDAAGVSIIEEPDAGHGMQIVRPDTVTGVGALLLIHGGGYVVGSNEEILFKASKFAKECGVPVLCPGYRLGPEDPFPACLDDCHAGWAWTLENADRLGIDASKIVIGGYSAGGGLAAGLAQRLHDEGGVQPSGQLLVYPMLDDQTANRRELDKPRHRVWSNRNNRFGWTGYLGHAPGQPSLPYAVPARREDLKGLPPAWVGVGTPDLFLDEDREYADRLVAAGVDTTYVEVDGGIHGFDSERTPLGDAFDASATAFVQAHTA